MLKQLKAVSTKSKESETSLHVNRNSFETVRALFCNTFIVKWIPLHSYIQISAKLHVLTIIITLRSIIIIITSVKSRPSLGRIVRSFSMTKQISKGTVRAKVTSN